MQYSDDINREVTIMGREIRRVPKGWEHPRDSQGEYKHMCDSTYKDAAEKYVKEFLEWQDDTSEIAKHKDDGCKYYWEFAGYPPDEDNYRPEFESEPTCYQVYQTVSEGTPVSPVFETKDELKVWLVNNGWTAEGADRFADSEWQPTLVYDSGRDITYE